MTQFNAVWIKVADSGIKISPEASGQTSGVGRAITIAIELFSTGYLLLPAAANKKREIMMSRMIYCTFLKREAEGQDYQIYPGTLGKRIYDTFSKEAWSQWQTKQTMLINEKKLCMINIADRKALEQEMINFLFEGQDVYIKGYTPLSE